MHNHIPLLEISNLNLSEEVKDELRIATMHGVDLTKYVNRFKNNPERLRYIRLLKQNHADEISENILTDLDESILKVILEYHKYGGSYRGILDQYTNDNLLLIETNTLVKILEANLQNKNISNYNFNKIKPELVDSFIFGINQGADLLDLQEYADKLDPEVVKLLINLSASGTLISSFLDGSWNIDQIYALLSGKGIINASTLISDYGINESFTEGSIREVIRAYSISFDLFELISMQIEDTGVPVFNQYQMYEINEGAKLGLDITKYCQPSLTDLEMRLIREELMEEVERRSGKKFKERVLTKTNIKLDDDFLMARLKHMNPDNLF